MSDLENLMRAVPEERLHIRRHRRRPGPYIASVIFALLLAAVAASVWIGVRGLQASGELLRAVPLAESAKAAMTAQDFETAQRDAEALAEHAASAAGLTSDPVWRAVELLPGVGSNLLVLREAAASVDSVASGAVVPLAKQAAGLDPSMFSPAGGRVELQPLIDAQPVVAGAAEQVASAHETMTDPRVADADVIGPLAAARTELTELLRETDQSLDALSRSLTIGPALLGAEGQRDVLLLFQNNAELRSLGGIPGALAVVRTDGGAFALLAQRSSRDFPRYDPPVVELPVETRALWGDNTARYVQDVTFTPDFPTAASIASEMWRRETGQTTSAVVALDPVTLSYLLRATGPITLPTGDVLDAENAVRLLLSDVYARYPDPKDQDAFFAGATVAVMDAVKQGADPGALISALAQAGSERRVLIWSAVPEEQEILQATTLAGLRPVSTEDEMRLGVYLNDMTGSKMSAYLDVELGAGSVMCRNDGRRNAAVSVTLTNAAPPDAASSLPAYVTGGGTFGVSPGNIRTSIHVYGPPGAYNLGVESGGELVPYHPTSDSGYTLSGVDVELAPGQSATYTFGFLADVLGMGDTVIESTPTIHTNATSQLALTCENALW
ncbi:DUF4012 domain-containing protein [Agromyces indicus]|uniref:DUF4012 domain-containing protein n=1 Tax=Agromyces indicus TaxID=758919 RepID=A0ABU1FJE6_9MICO|nr:DUF4012 domain-containing protein [Agromyces indicus]MDR5691581.1 DUF4012 domain-containing protein [Agromyces indicus]